MKFSIRLNILLVFVALLFAACEKDNMDEIVIDEPDYQPEVNETNPLFLAMSTNNPEGLELGCISILYPFDMALESGSTLTINSESEFTAAIDTTAMDPAVDFIYPLDILNGEGETAQVASIEELGLSFVACIPSNGWDYGSTAGNLIPAFSFTDLCFDLVYPVALEDLEGNTYTADSESELIDLSATVGDLYFTLPITVLNVDGSEIEIESYNGFFNLVESCDGMGVNPPVVVNGQFEVTGFGCWELQFPFTLELTDGTTTEVNTESEYATTILNAGEEFQLIYPFTLQSLLDDEELTVSNDDEFIFALESCGIIIDIGGGGDCGSSEDHIILFFNEGSCYTVNYPAQVQAEGVTYTLNGIADYFDVFGMYASQVDAIEIIYPISATNTETGTETILNNRDEICDYVNACFDDDNDFPGCDNPSEDDQTIHVPLFFSAYNFFSVFDCPFDFEYPVQIEVEGTTYDINNRDDYQAVVSPFTPGEATLIFPITVIEESGATLTLNSNADVCSFISSCE
jgi:hypothetical protein